MLQQYADEETLGKGQFTRFTLHQAYHVLEIDHPENIDDDGITAVFHSRCIDLPSRGDDFKTALEVIQHFRNSDGGVGTARSGSANSNKGTTIVRERLI
jgi:hypothetical protein